MADFNADEFRGLTNSARQAAIALEKARNATSSNTESTIHHKRETDKSKDSIRGLGHVASSVTSAFKSVASGTASFSTLGSIVTASTGAVTDFTKKLGIGGTVVGTAVDAIGNGISTVLEQYDTTLKTFQRLSESGLAGVDGIDTLRQNMVRTGVPMEMFANMILKNTESLAGLTGSADKSAKQFSQMMSTMQNGLDQPLRDLGFTAEEIGETLVTFSNLQRRLGNLQTMDQDKLTKGAVKFGKELDAIAKLTGQTRTEQQKSLDAAMREARFLASQRKLQSQGDAGKQAANEIKNLMLGMEKVSPAMAQAVKDVSGGFVHTEAAKQAFVSTGGAITRVLASMRSGNMDYETAMQELQGGIKQTLPTMEAIGLAVGDTTGAFIPLHESVNLATFAMGDFKKAIEENRKTQEAQIEADSGTTTKELVNAQKHLWSSASHLQATAISFDKVSGGLESVMKGLDSVSKGTYRRIGTIGDIERPSATQTQIDIDIRANNQLLADAKNRKSVLESRLGTKKQFRGRDKLEAELADLNIKIPALTKSVLSDIETRRKEQLTTGKTTLGRLFRQLMPDGSIFGDKNSALGTSDFNSPQALKDIIEQNSGLNATRVVSPEIQGKIMDSWRKNPDLDSKKFWDELKPIFDKMKDDNANQLGNTTSLDETQNEKITSAMSSLSNSNIETNKKLDSIVTALNQGNKNTQGSDSNIETNKKLDSIVTALNQGNKNTKDIKQYVQVV